MNRKPTQSALFVFVSFLIIFLSSTGNLWAPHDETYGYPDSVAGQFGTPDSVKNPRPHFYWRKQAVGPPVLNSNAHYDDTILVGSSFAYDGSRFYRDLVQSRIIDVRVGAVLNWQSNNDVVNDGKYYWQLVVRDTIYNNMRAGPIDSIFINIPPIPFSAAYSGSPDPLYSSSIAFGDHNNDAKLDLVMTGDKDITGKFTDVYDNGTSFGFFPIGNTTIWDVSDGDVAWGDYDRDGDIDLAVTGFAGATNVADIYRNDGSSTFTDIGASIQGVRDGALDWGDYDNDGDLDLVLTGGSGSGGFTEIYRNNGNGTFSSTNNTSILDMDYSAVAFGDYDRDADLDLVISGFSSGVRRTRLYNNDGIGNFTELSGTGLHDMYYSKLAWGDFDNDGYLDLVLSGNEDLIGKQTKVYRNNSGNGTFSLHATLKGMTTGSVHWGDIDNDGDLDIFINGEDSDLINMSKFYINNNSTFQSPPDSIVNVEISCADLGDYDNDNDLDIFLTGLGPSGRIAQTFRNDHALSNFTPNSPLNPSSTVTGNSVTLTWTKSSGDNTPLNGLSSNVRVGLSQNSQDVVSAMADLNNGKRRIPKMGNAQLNNNYILKNLSEGKHYWSVQCIDNSYIGSSFSVRDSFIIDTTAPAQPQGLIATPLENKISIRWNSNSGSDLSKYYIYYASTPNPAVISDSATDSTILISGLTNGITYYVRIKAKDLSGNMSTYSTEVNAKPGDYITPAIPQNLTVTPGNYEVTLRWSKLNEPDLLRYRIFFGTSANPTAPTDSVTADTFKIINNLSAGTTYYFRIAGVDTALNVSPYSNEVNAKPLDLTAPAAPQILSANAGDKSVSLIWKKNTEADLLRYRIYSGTSPNPVTISDSVSADTVRTLTNLNGGATYYFRVSALDTALNESPKSNELNVIPYETSRLIAPVGNQTISSPAFTFVWTKVATNNFGYTLIVGKKLGSGPTVQDSVIAQNNPESDTTYPVTGFVNGKYYWYVKNRGYNVFSAVDSFIINKADIALLSPVSGIPTNSETPVLRWSRDPQNTAGYSIFVGRARTDTSVLNLTYTGNTSTGTDTIKTTSLLPAGLYYWKVYGSYSNIDSFIVPAVTYSLFPENNSLSDTLHFGNVIVNQNVVQKAVMINNSASVYTVNSVSPTPSEGLSVTTSKILPGTLSPAETLWVTITFLPTQQKIYSSQLNAVISGFQYQNALAIKGIGIAQPVGTRPVVLSPVGGTRLTQIPVLFSWSKVNTANRGYYFYIGSTYNTGNNTLADLLVEDSTNHDDSTMLSVNLKNIENGLYYWRVVNINTNEASAVDSFSLDLLFTINLILPINNAQVGEQPSFSWENVLGNTGYTLMIGRGFADTTLTGIVYSAQLNQNATSHIVSSPLSAGKHFWKVYGSQSKVDSFSVVINAPSVVIRNQSGNIIPSYDFDSVANATSKLVTLFVRNEGTLATNDPNGIQLLATSPFSVNPNNIPRINPNSEFQISLTFTPNVSNSYIETLTVKDANSAQTYLKFPVFGTGFNVTGGNRPNILSVSFGNGTVFVASDPNPSASATIPPDYNKLVIKFDQSMQPDMVLSSGKIKFFLNNSQLPDPSWEPLSWNTPTNTDFTIIAKNGTQPRMWQDKDTIKVEVVANAYRNTTDDSNFPADFYSIVSVGQPQEQVVSYNPPPQATVQAPVQLNVPQNLNANDFQATFITDPAQKDPLLQQLTGSGFAGMSDLIDFKYQGSDGNPLPDTILLKIPFSSVSTDFTDIGIFTFLTGSNTWQVVGIDSIQKGTGNIHYALKRVTHFSTYTVASDPVVPIINYSNPIDRINENTTATIQFQVEDNAGINTFFYYKPAGKTVYLDTLLNGSSLKIGSNYTYSYSIQLLQADDRGIDYYIYVDDGVHEKYYPDGLSYIPHIRRDYSQKLVTFDLPGFNPNVTNQNFFRMISFPYEINNNGSVDYVLARFLGSSDNKNWRVFRWNNNQYYEHSKDMNFTLFKPGQACWIITDGGTANRFRTEFRIDAGSSIPASQSYSISVNGGWNQIGNPFNFPVSWDSVLAENNFNPPPTLYEYDGAGYQPRIEMLPQKGYFVKIPGSGSLSLIIPAVDNTSGSLKTSLSKIEKKLVTREAWQFNFKVQSGELYDALNTFGIGRQTEVESELPYIGNFIKSTFISDNRTQSELMSEIKASNLQGDYLWNFEVESNLNGEEAIIDLSSLSELSAFYNYALIDRTSHFYFIPSAENQYLFRFEINSEKDTHHFSLLVGSQEYIEKSIRGLSILSNQLHLAQNIPNPFNPETNLSFILPAKNGTSQSYPVSLNIYSPEGTLVRTLVHQNMSSGYYSLLWDGRNNKKVFVNSGVYLYQLKVGSQTKTHKMLLLK